MSHQQWIFQKYLINNEWMEVSMSSNKMCIVQFQFMSHCCPYKASNFSDGQTQISSNSDVVYFDQGMHASACVRMVENDQRHQTFFFVFLCKPLKCLSCTRWKRYFFIIFQCFSSFSTMQTHVQVCIYWLKYTTFR